MTRTDERSHPHPTAAPDTAAAAHQSPEQWLTHPGTPALSNRHIQLTGVPLQVGRPADIAEQQIHLCRRLLRRSLPSRTGRHRRAGGMGSLDGPSLLGIGAVSDPVRVTERRSICPGFSGKQLGRRIGAAGDLAALCAARRILPRENVGSSLHRAAAESGAHRDPVRAVAADGDRLAHTTASRFGHRAGSRWLACSGATRLLQALTATTTFFPNASTAAGGVRSPG